MVTDTLRVMSMGKYECMHVSRNVEHVCNRMSTSNLESMMRVAIEGPDNDFDDIPNKCSRSLEGCC